MRTHKPAIAYIFDADPSPPQRPFPLETVARTSPNGRYRRVCTPILCWLRGRPQFRGGGAGKDDELGLDEDEVRDGKVDIRAGLDAAEVVDAVDRGVVDIIAPYDDSRDGGAGGEFGQCSRLPRIRRRA